MLKISELNSLGFNHTHDIVLGEGNEPYFRRVSNSLKLSEAASVYVWISSHDSSLYEVLYCGKAGYGPQRRMAQHFSGFRHSSVGRDNHDLIVQKLLSDRKILVYSRESKTQKIFGAIVSLYSAEEEALCDLFKPIWNRAKFPGSKKINTKPPNSVNLASSLVVDFEDVARGREISAHISTLDDRRKADFYKIVRLLSEYLVADEVEQKISGRYSNQPRHYNNTPMLVYSRLSKGGRALKNGWYARVPLVNTDVAPMTVFLNESSLRPDYDPKFVTRQRNVFVPKDLTHFINHPELYLIQL